MVFCVALRNASAGGTCYAKIVVTAQTCVYAVATVLTYVRSVDIGGQVSSNFPYSLYSIMYGLIYQ